VDGACDGAAAARGHGRLRRRRLALQPHRQVAGVKLRIMQPNLPQDARFNYYAKGQVMQKYLALSDRATGRNRRRA